MTPDENDIAAQVREIENLPELQDAFNEIEKIKDNASGTEDDTSEEVVDSEEIEIEDQPIDKDEEEEAQVETKKEKRGDKYRKLQNDKYRALAEKEEALERVQYLEAMLQESLNSGTYHYSKNAYSELDKAKEAKQRAIEEGDSQALIDADINIYKALNAVSELEQWANENNGTRRTAYDSDANDTKYKAVHAAMAQDWLESHPYLKPNSRTYNSDLATQVTEFINYLDTDLYDKNESHLIFSEDYFDTIDDYISSLKSPKRDNARHIESFSHVGRVRNVASVHGENSSSSATKMTLTKDEKRMAENAGVPLKEWLRYKIEDSRTVKNR